jgi:hypothetical protein
MSLHSYNSLEIAIFNALDASPKHKNCSLIVRESNQDLGREGLFCLEHDHYFRWIADGEYEFLKEFGINRVVYDKPEDEWALLNSLTIPNPIKVKNIRSGKLVSINRIYKGNPQRDPSMPEYWKFIDSFK